MATDLINSALRSTPGSTLDSATGALEGRAENVTQGLRAAVAAVVGSLVAKSATGPGLAEIMAVLRDDWHGQVGASPHAYVGEEAVRSGSARVDSVLGERRGSLIDHLSGSLGLAAGSAASLVNLAVPLVLAALSRAVGQNSSDRDVQAILAEQEPYVRRDNVAGVGPFIGAAPTGRRGLPWWLWLLALLGLLLLALLLFKGCNKPDLRPAAPASDVAQTASGPQVATPPIAVEKVTLPGGAVVDLRPNTLNYNLQQFLGSDRPAPQTFTFEDVHFDTDSAALRPEAKETVANLAAILKAYPNVRVKLEGHTDEQGTPALNQALSERRAKAVAQSLSTLGIPAGRMTTAGFGETRPVDTNATAAGRQDNRRTDLTVVQK